MGVRGGGAASLSCIEEAGGGGGGNCLFAFGWDRAPCLPPVIGNGWKVRLREKY